MLIIVERLHFAGTMQEFDLFPYVKFAFFVRKREDDSGVRNRVPLNANGITGIKKKMDLC